MSLCINYCAPNMEYIDVAPQIRIKYRPQDSTLEQFIEIHSNQVIYIDASEVELFKEAGLLKRLQELKKFNNWILQISANQIKGENNFKFDAIKDCCNKYMFTDSIGNWEVLQFIISLNPCEVYLTNMLAWELQQVYKVCTDNNIGIRLYANLAQASWDNCPDLQKFFIRPEDLTIYEPFTTGIEFAGDTKTIQEVMYKTYTRGYWSGDLSEIIMNFNSKVDSRRLPAEFGEWRIGCNKRCIKGGSCGLCTRMVEFAERMDKTDTVIIPSAKR